MAVDAPIERLNGRGLERWFAAAGQPVRLDMARSGAPPRSARDLLDLAGPAQVQEYLDLSLDYGPGIGTERLRAAISTFTGSSPADVIVTHGAVEALLLACGTAIGDRHLVAVASPAYEAMYLGVEAMGGIAHPVPVWEPGSARLDLAAIADLDLRRYAAVVVNSPHNPTGLQADVAELEHLADCCARAGAALIVDEVSMGTLDPGAVSFGTSRAVESQAVVLIGDVSKAFGLGGLRVGWCATTCPQRRRRLATLRDVTSLANSAPSQHLAALALENRAQLSISGMARTNLDRLGVCMASLPGSSWVPPTDGLVAFPGLAIPGFASVAFAELLLAKHRVSVAPGRFFGQDGHLRVGLGLSVAAFAEGLAQLSEAMSEAATSEPAMAEAMREAAR